MAMALIALAFWPEAEAKPKRSAASALPDLGFNECVATAVLGKNGAGCSEGEAPDCVGLRRALELSEKITECLIPQGLACREWGHGGRTQAHWVSIAAAHLAKFGNCIHARYGSETSSGLEEASDDNALISALKRLDDGSKVFRLTDSTILLRALAGDRFSEIIGDSPFAKEISSHQLALFKSAADTPQSLEATAALEDEAGSEARGAGRAHLYRARKGFQANMPEYHGAMVIGDQRRPAQVAVKAAAVAIQPTATTSPAPQSHRKQPSPYSLGLDRSLFERVSAAYQRNEKAMRGMDDYVRIYRPSPPRDLGELLSRGGTL